MMDDHPGRERLTPYRDARILIVGDSIANPAWIAQVLDEAGYGRIVTLLEMDHLAFALEGFEPHLVVMNRPCQDTEALRTLRELDMGHGLKAPVLFMFPAGGHEQMGEVLALGSTDVVMDAADGREVSLRAGRLIHNFRIMRRMAARAARLEQEVREAATYVEDVHAEMLARMARIIEQRNDGLGKHTWRVARISGAIARVLGLDETFILNLQRAARLHDLGKIVMPDRVLFDVEPLRDMDRDAVRVHPTVGASILSGGVSALVRLAESVALTHHERWDGSGYPFGLIGDAAPIEGRIVAVADAFDAMTAGLSYTRKLSEAEAAMEIQACAGTRFDPAVADAFQAAYAARLWSTSDLAKPAIES